MDWNGADVYAGCFLVVFIFHQLVVACSCWSLLLAGNEWIGRHPTSRTSLFSWTAKGVLSTGERTHRLQVRTRKVRAQKVSVVTPNLIMHKVHTYIVGYKPYAI